MDPGLRHRKSLLSAIGRSGRAGAASVVPTGMGCSAGSPPAFA
jgi:hypothetical protein